MNDIDLSKELQTAIASADPQALERLTFWIGDAVLEEGIFPNSLFHSVLSSLQDSKFQEMEGSWKLIRVFEENWKELSHQQKAELLLVFKQTYGLFRDWMACFVISGILGELYADERAFDVLAQLQRSRSEIPRSFVPHGLEHLAQQPGNPELAHRAFAALTAMKEDSSPRVQQEVAESFSRLNKGR